MEAEIGKTIFQPTSSKTVAENKGKTKGSRLHFSPYVKNEDATPLL
jgi:hypothetical protein